MKLMQRMASYWCCIGMELMGVFLAGAAYAVNIPPIPEMSSEAVALHPELVQRRAALRLERDQLHDRALSHNSKCGSVEEGSAAETSCASQLKALSAAVDRHIQASTQFIEDYNAAEAARIDDAIRRESISGTTQDANLDPMVVDARNVPSGLPKSVDDAIPHTPSGERVRKGFQAVQDGDWKVALAWFQDARNKEPGNPGIARLVDLAQFTLDYRTRVQTQASEKNSTHAKSAQTSNLSTTSKSTGSAAKSGTDPVASAAASQMAAKARADAAFKKYVEKYGERDAAGRASAGAKAARGEGYSDEELKAQLQKALEDYRKAHKKRDRSPVGGSPAADEIILGSKG